MIEGDQQTSRDADRVRATGAPAVQINTGKGCHLDAHMVGKALRSSPLADGGLLLIENVGNLVCPAAFDLGEAHKVVILSVTEGEDKPLKYPDMFHAADLLLVNKVDLLPHLDFDVEAAIGFAHRVRPGLEVLRVSATHRRGFRRLARLAAARRRRGEGRARREPRRAAPPRGGARGRARRQELTRAAVTELDSQRWRGRRPASPVASSSAASCRAWAFARSSIASRPSSGSTAGCATTAAA